MTGDQLTLTLLAAFWAGTSALFSGIKNTNEIRDKIILGKIEKEEVSCDHLRRLLFLDWLPMKVSLVAVSLVLGFIMVMLPQLAKQEAAQNGCAVICYVTAVVPLTGAITFGATGALEFHYLRKEIRRREAHVYSDSSS
jgi:hypothetical protein